MAKRTKFKYTGLVTQEVGSVNANKTAITGAVLVTGASRGIGEACALHLDKLGFTVFAGVRKATDGDALKQRASGALTPIVMDIADATSIMSAAQTIANSVAEAGLAGLVNNAGIAVAGPLEFLPVAKIREQFEVNVIGQIAVTQAFLPLLRKGRGRIVNMGSMEGRTAMPFVGPYCASKFAIEALTDALRMELQAWCIPVSIVEPGTVATSILERSIAAAEESVRNLPRQAHDLYDPAIAAARDAADRIARTTLPAHLVAEAVAHALTSRRPKTRYIVGRDARFMALLARFAPDRVRNWLILRQMGLPKSAPSFGNEHKLHRNKEDQMNVLITGGAGRLGIAVCKTFLQNGLKVRVFDLDTPRNRKSIKQLDGKAEIAWGDITEPDSVRKALQGADAVVHMAAILPPVAYEKPQLADKVNVGGTKTIVDLIKERGGNIPFVFTSSVAAFGPTPNASQPLCPDRTDPRPRGAYGETKLQAENLIKQSGIDYAILRLTATMYLAFGVSDLKRMFTVPLSNRIEYCHPDDTALAILNAVKNFHTAKGNTLVISGGPEQRMLYKDMIKAILGIMGLPVPPAHKFTTKPYYLDWYDTTKSQKLLRFQRNTFVDYLKDYSRQLTRQYGSGFLPFMRNLVGPVFGKAIVQFF